jgi:hypothetical protein
MPCVVAWIYIVGSLVVVKRGVRVRRNCNIFKPCHGKCVKRLTWQNRLSRHHTQMHFKCTHFFNHFQIARSWRWYRFPVYIKTMRSCSSPAHKVFRDRMTKNIEEVDAISCFFPQTKCTLENDVIHHCERSFLVAHDFDIRIFF